MIEILIIIGIIFIGAPIVGESIALIIKLWFILIELVKDIRAYGFKKAFRG